MNAMIHEQTITGTTQSGFHYTLDQKSLDNMELLDALSDATGDNPLAVSNVCKLMLGNEQRKALYDHVRADDGRVPVDAVSAELIEMFGAFGTAGKNS